MLKLISKDMNKTGGLPKALKLFEEAKVMLRSNMDIAEGLRNKRI